VRRLAAEASLPVATKKDSTGICFIGERNFDAFIARYLNAEPGEIRTPEEQVIGQHRGLIHYTLGQRKGLDIGGLKELSRSALVRGLQGSERNVLYAVQDTHHPLLMSTRLSAGLNWIAARPRRPARGWRPRFVIASPTRPARSSCDDERLVLEFDQPQRAVTPGQSVVLYDGDECLGGGVISQQCAPAAGLAPDRNEETRFGMKDKPPSPLPACCRPVNWCARLPAPASAASRPPRPAWPAFSASNPNPPRMCTAASVGCAWACACWSNCSGAAATRKACKASTTALGLAKLGTMIQRDRKRQQALGREIDLIESAWREARTSSTRA
jgi:hypothetical protein